MSTTRRNWLKGACALSAAPALGALTGCAGTGTAGTPALQRVRPTDAAWPSAAHWNALGRSLTGSLIRVASPLEACVGTSNAACADLFKQLKNPYFIGDSPALTQTLGWVDAWTTQPSVYAVAAETAADVAAAVNFARQHRLRLVVKGGGHSYLGTSNAADSLMIWTRRMNSITVHDAFVGQGCAGSVSPRPAASIGAGAIWMPTYDEIVTRHGRYVQGGGCATVGVAGLIQSGGFGSFSKHYGTAAGSLLEAEVVTADGRILVVNACQHPELFWGLKGGGGGSLGVVTRVTLETHELPETFGGFTAAIRATSDDAYRRLLAKLVDHYAERLFNSQWGEQIALKQDNTVEIGMVFQGMSARQAKAVWTPFLEWIAQQDDVVLTAGPRVNGVPARHFWDPTTFDDITGRMLRDSRPNAPADNVFWSGNEAEAGHFLHGYQSAWLPANLLEPASRSRLVDTFFAATRHFSISLHVNKGLAGGRPEAIRRSRDTAMNPAAFDAFALLIAAVSSEPAYPGVPGHQPDLTAARANAHAIDGAMREIYRLVPKSQAGAYVSESDYFDDDWAQSYWGSNYARLLKIKQKYDPDCLFFVHNGVGTEGWSRDGFSRLG